MEIKTHPLGRFCLLLICIAISGAKSPAAVLSSFNQDKPPIIYLDTFQVAAHSSSIRGDIVPSEYGTSISADVNQNYSYSYNTWYDYKSNSGAYFLSSVADDVAQWDYYGTPVTEDYTDNENFAITATPEETFAVENNESNGGPGSYSNFFIPSCLFMAVITTWLTAHQAPISKADYLVALMP